MGLVTYDGKRLIPAPFVSFVKQMQTTADGTKVGNLWDLSINGTVVAFMGSPDSGGVFWTAAGYPPDQTVISDARLGSLFRKKEAIRQLFKTDGLDLVFQSDDSSTPLSCNPRIKDIRFNEGIWFDKFEYNISAEADIIYGLPGLEDERFAQYISAATEGWEIQEAETPGVYSLNHTISATGKRFFSGSGLAPSGAWEYAKLYVNSQLGYDSTKVTQSVLGSGSINFNSLTNFNFSRTESLNEKDGSYAVTESWVLATGNAFENYTASVAKTPQDSQKTASVSLQGNIQGLYVNLGDRAGAYNNALTRWNIVKGQLQGRAQSLVSSTVFGNGSVEHDYSKGVISYNYDYDNSPVSTGTNALDEFTVTKKFGYEDYLTTVSIDGKIQGRLLDSEDDYALRYPRASSQWVATQALLYSRAGAYSHVSGLKTSPTSKSVVENPIEGSVTYSYEFNNRQFDNYKDEFTVSQRLSQDAQSTIINIQGTIQGFDVYESGNLYHRYNGASGALPTDAQIYGRALAYTNLNFPNNILSKEITRQPNLGAITYNYEYSTEPSPLLSGAISEVIEISNDYRCDVVAEFSIPDRIAGPYLQSINTKTRQVQTLSYEAVYVASTGVTASQLLLRPNINTICSGFVPIASSVYTISDQERWLPKKGRISRNISWLYQ
jgi:hypothetical protein